MNLLDTNICIAFLRRRSPLVAKRMEDAGAHQLCISSITAAELFVGALKSNRASMNMADVHSFVSTIRTLNFDTEAARLCGHIRWTLERTGSSIGPLDLLIASHAESIDATLITNNTREFARVPGLKIEDWTQ